MKTAFVNHSRGLGLVEMMVAITLGLLIMAAVSTLLVTNKVTYTTQDALSRLQENARVALQYIEHDIRLAGYFGCNASSNPETLHQQVNSTATYFDTGNPVEGLEGSDPTPQFRPSNTTWGTLGIADVVPGSDAFAVRYADPSTAASLTKQMTQTSASMQVTQNSGIQAGDILMVTDCSSTDIFQVTNFNTAGGFDHVDHNSNSGNTISPGNTGNPNKLWKPYDVDAKVMQFMSVRYYIKQRPDGVRALYRQQLVTSGNASTPVERELVEGVEDMRITYGVASTGVDRIPNQYLKAGQAGLITPTDWANVVSVRVGLLMASLANADVNTPDKTYGTQVDASDYDVNGETVTAPALRRDRRVFVTTVTIRNRK